MAATLQPKLRGFSIVNDMNINNINEISADITTQFLSLFETLIGYLFRSLINLLPPFTGGDEIRHWLHVGGYYVVAAVVLITCICCLFCLCSCIGSIFSCMFMCFSAIFKLLFRFIFYLIRLLFKCLFFVVKRCFSAVGSFSRWCLCRRRRSAAKMMKAPTDKPSMTISTGESEANPQGYFSGNPSNYVC